MASEKVMGREKLFNLMREYHSNRFPESFPTKELTELRANFGRIEDQVVSMAMGFTYGRGEFVDSTHELTYFKNQSAKLASSDLKNIYQTKIEQITDLLNLVKSQSVQSQKSAQTS
jgi:hypothetical protein